MSTTYTLWHGSRHWEGTPTIQGPKKGRGELGPGLYVTTHFARAQDYSKGGGVVRRIIFEPRYILEDMSLSLQDALEFTTSVVVKAKQGSIIERLIVNAQNHNHEDKVLLGSGTEHVHATSLVNMCINADATLGNKGVALAEFLASQGIDCSFMHKSGNEYWGVIFNPRCISSYAKVLAKEVGYDKRDLLAPALQRAVEQTRESVVQGESGLWVPRR
jgi:hypothetical protein